MDIVTSMTGRMVGQPNLLVQVVLYAHHQSGRTGIFKASELPSWVQLTPCIDSDGTVILLLSAIYLSWWWSPFDRARLIG